MLKIDDSISSRLDSKMNRCINCDKCQAECEIDHCECSICCLIVEETNVCGVNVFIEPHFKDTGMILTEFDRSRLSKDQQDDIGAIVIDLHKRKELKKYQTAIEVKKAYSMSITRVAMNRYTFCFHTVPSSE